MYIDRFLEKRRYIFSPEKDDFIKDILEKWMISNPDYVIRFVSNSKSDIYTIKIPDDNFYYIIWDSSFWSLLEYFLYIIDERGLSLQYDYNSIIENNAYIGAFLLKYLSNRYSFFEPISKRLEREAKSLGYYILEANIDDYYHNELVSNLRIEICKMFVFFHEVAHIEFKKFDTENGLLKRESELVYVVLRGVPSDILKENFPFLNLKKKIEEQSISLEILEELAADLRAFQRLMEFESIAENKEILGEVFFSFISLMDFIAMKSAIDGHWDHYFYHKKGEFSPYLETQLLRRLIFPYMICTSVGVEDLGISLAYDMEVRNKNIDLFSSVINIIGDKWYIKRNLEINHTSIYTLENIQEEKILNTVLSHMSKVTYKTSCKRIQSLFNRAHNAQHSNDPLSSIPLYQEYISQALAKENQYSKNIGDAYSRIARVYAENGEYEKSTIYINISIKIYDGLYIEDISTAFLSNNIGNVLLLLGRIDEAIKSYKDSAKIRIKFGEFQSRDIATVYSNLGDAYYLNGDVYQSLKYYLMAYNIIKDRYSGDNEAILKLKKPLEILANAQSNIKGVEVSISTPIDILKQKYESNISNNELLREYLLGLVRDILNAPFDEASKMYIELSELVERNCEESLGPIFFYGFLNIRKVLNEELQHLDNKQ